jgi:hypothetical protein
VESIHSIDRHNHRRDVFGKGAQEVGIYQIGA